MSEKGEPVAEMVRALNRRGITAFRAYLDRLRAGDTSAPPRDLLTDSGHSAPLPIEVSVEDRAFGDRLEAAHYLCEALGALAEREDDEGLWTWLSLYYFDHVCPPAPNGTRSPGRDYRHILEPRYPYAHRHLIAGSVLVYRLHGDDARLLLATRLRTENRFHHELASRQAFLTNRALMGAASLLYLNRRTKRPKRGSGMSARVPGTLLRFVAVIQQLDVNYDLYSMTPEAIVDLLPDEFRRWKPRARRRRVRRKVHAE